NFDRKFIQRCNSRDKGDAGRPGDSEIELLTGPMIRNLFYAVGKPRWTFGRECCFCSSRTQESFRQRLRDERTRSNFRLKISFRMKSREREVYCEAGYSETRSQCARGWNPRRIIIESSRREFITNLPVKLFMQWFGRCAIQPDHFKSH